MRWMLFAALIGCGHPAPLPNPPAVAAHAPPDAAPDAPLDEDLPRLAERSTELYRELAVAVGSAGDCAAAADKLEALTTTYAEVIDASARLKRGDHAKVAQLQLALALHQRELAAAAKAIEAAPIIAQCAHDDRFVAALDKLAGAAP